MKPQATALATLGHYPRPNCSSIPIDVKPLGRTPYGFLNAGGIGHFEVV